MGLRSCCDATGAIFTRQTGTSVEFLFTMTSYEFSRTNASVIGHLIDTRSVIPAQIR